MKFVFVALLSAVTLAVAERGHGHAAFHKRAAPIVVRDATAVEVVEGPVVTVYVLDGKVIPASEVEQGLKDGKYVLISVPETSIAAPTKSIAPPQQFFQKSISTSEAPVPTPEPTTKVVAPAPPAKTPSSGGSGTGLNSKFPSGEISCSQFPSAYGAQAVPWMELGGWSGIQQTPDFNFGLDSAISYIITSISGDKCGPKSFCSYACPPGYQKSQWPTAQGNTGQSIGGLYCNANNKLELSNPDAPQLCIAGVGGVQVKNKMSKNVCVCRTDYPGTESETVPLDATPGGTFPLTCPDATTYYQWQGSHTSAQYYINPSGAPCSEACIWGSAGTNLGNWAPVNAGVGKGTDGITYLSLFPNAPTNPDGVLDYTIRITGASGECEYKGGMYYSNGVKSPNGCTVSSSQIVFPFPPNS